MVNRPIVQERFPPAWQDTWEWIAGKLDRRHWVECKARFAKLAGETIGKEGRGGPEAGFIPDARQIAEACRSIQSRWTAEELAKRVQGELQDRVSNRFLELELKAEQEALCPQITS